MTAATPTSYDELPYPSVPKVWTHPDRLATMARLYGLEPPPVDRCRVLELGCSDGGNLLPMAVALPEGEFVGVDYAPGQVAAGRAVVAALGLPNISLRTQDVRTLGDDLGQFDYIIAYGIYSWVPPEAQEAILGLCRRHLAPNGVAFVSYNTYPGWHVRAMVREMLLYHVAEIQDIGERVAAARRFLDFLADSTEALRGHFANALHFDVSATILERERDHLRTHPDTYLAHELLEDVNAPVYFHEFAARAAEHGLQYLAEAEFAMMQLGNLPEPVSDGLRRISRSRVENEQYLDFLFNRAFRQTLLCHAEVSLKPSPAALASLAVASPAEPIAPTPDVNSDAPERFRGPSGSVVRLSSPLVKAALVELHECWPQALPFRELLDRARARADQQTPESHRTAGPSSDGSGPLDDPDVRSLAQQLLRCTSLGLVEPHGYVPRFTLEVSERPVACPLARYQAQRGLPVANRRHEPVRFEDKLAQAVLSLLDGSHDRAALREQLGRLAASGHLETNGTSRASDARSGDEGAGGAAMLEDALRWLARSALLVG